MNENNDNILSRSESYSTPDPDTPRPIVKRQKVQKFTISRERDCDFLELENAQLKDKLKSEEQKDIKKKKTRGCVPKEPEKLLNLLNSLVSDNKTLYNLTLKQALQVESQQDRIKELEGIVQAISHSIYD
jgi:hypothetical protein